MSMPKSMPKPVTETSKIFALALGLSALSLGGAMAQETAPATTEPAATEAPAAPATEAPAADAQAAGAEAPAAQPDPNAPGTIYVKETIDDWEVRCVRMPEGRTEPCQTYQLLKDGDGTPVAEVALFPLPKGGQAAAGASISVPLETLLTEHLRLQIDSGQVRSYEYAWCDRLSCVARVGFAEADIKAMKAGSKGKVVIVPVGAPDKPVELAISLKGFTKAYDSLPVPAQ